MVRGEDRGTIEGLSVEFRTEYDATAWRRIWRGVHPRRRRSPESLDFGVFSQRRRFHLDAEVERRSGQPGIQWDLFLHGQESMVRSDPLSKRVGWLEGFGRWIESAYARPLVLAATCSGTFEFAMGAFQNAFSIPRPLPAGFANEAAVNGSTLFSMGVERGSERTWCSADTRDGTFIIGVGFLIDGLRLETFVEQIEQEAWRRAEAWVTRRVDANRAPA